MFDKGDFYDGMTGKAVMELMEVFAKQGHSGMSAGITIALFTKLAQFKALGPLTDNSDEWYDHRVDGPSPGPNWQNKRQGSCFSYDEGKTYYNLDEERQWLRRITPWRIYRKLPMSWKYPFHKSVHKEN